MTDAPPNPPGRDTGNATLRANCPECDKEVSVKYITQHRRKQHGVIQRRSRNDPLPGKDVVETVLDVVFPKGVPVKHLDAVIRWCDATVAFMKEVQ